MSKLLFITLQTICNVACITLVGLGADFAKIGDFREWMFITGAVIVCIPILIEMTLWWWNNEMAQRKVLHKACLSEDNNDKENKNK